MPELRTAAITVVRNERGLLPAWLSHTRALIDHVYVADHCSTDGTRDLLRDWASTDPGIRVFSYDDEVYDREKILNTLRRVVFDETDSEWLFILDPDEFLRYQSRNDFHVPLTATTGGVAEYRWRNSLPETPGAFADSIPCRAQTRVSALGKVAISRAVA